jgi:hypothetical protein
LEYKHGLVVDDILYSSWGYDQTNISWYQVIDVSEKSVKIREIEGKIVGGGSQGSDSVMPVLNKFSGAPIVKLVRSGDSVRINSYSYASKWDGRAKSQTAFGYGH